MITQFENGMPSEQQKDTNFDGRFDVISQFEKGTIKSRKKDRNYNHKWDFYSTFDNDGLLLKTREDTTNNGKIDRIRLFRAGEPYRVETDTDGNGFFETVSLLENQKVVKNLIDKNQDGIVDVEIFFNDSQEKERLISDFDLDGKKDTWQTYAYNRLVTLHRDENGDGRLDLKVLYRKGVKVSLVIHFFVFLYFAGVYKNNTISTIELSIHQISKPNVRNIPKPRFRQKEMDISNVKMIKTRQVAIPKLKIDRVQTYKMDHTYETISMPDLPDTIDISGLAVPKFQIQTPAQDFEPHESHVEYTSAKEYFEMLNLRIHNAKKYPESAKSRHLEGRVKIEFILQTDGSLTDIKVVKSSRHRNLDDAALEAIKNASPFPRPPAFIFIEPVTLRVNILFELV